MIAVSRAAFAIENRNNLVQTNWYGFNYSKQDKMII